jgi:K+-transporting ATPase KdpF subunit
LASFCWRPLTRPAAERSNPIIAMENLIAGSIAVALIVYLIVTILRPEKF